VTRPLVWLSAAIAAGAWLGGRGSFGVGAPLLLSALLLPLAVFSRSARFSGLALLWCGFALAAVGAIHESREHEASSLRRFVEAHHSSSHPVLLQGTAVRDGEDQGELFRVTLDVDAVRHQGVPHDLRGRVLLQVQGLSDRPPVRLGDRLVVWATLWLPRGFANPGSFDLAAHARRAGVHAYGRCKSPRLLRVVGREEVGLIREMASRLRAWARARLAESLAPGPERALCEALVIGDRGGLDEATSESFRVAGTYHVLAISGAQVALLAGLLLWGLPAIGVGRAAVAITLTLLLVFYAELVGGDTPVVRAVTMAVAVAAGKCLDLDADPLNMLGLSAGILLLRHPLDIDDVGFQLSFAATMGLVALTPLLVRRAARLPRRLSLPLAASLSAQLALLPLLAAHFHRLAPAALLLNLVAVPLASAVLLGGFGLLLVSAIAPALSSPLGIACFWSARALLASGELVGELPWLDVRVPTPSLWAATLLPFGLVLLAGERLRRPGGVMVVGGLLGLTVARTAAPGDGRLSLTVLDVGQGEALVVRSPAGRYWLVDAGPHLSGRFDAGERVVAPYLFRLGLRRLDRVLVTHAHLDHCGGLPALLRGFRIGELWEGPAAFEDAVYRELDDQMSRTALTRRTVFQGVTSDWDGVEVQVLGPNPRSSRPSGSVSNDDSVVLGLRLGRVRFLLTGDVGGEAERRLGDVRSMVIKVPHHGSRSSSGVPFVRAVSPAVAVVSAGAASFGHPDAVVLSRYASAGAAVFRTDRDGAVTVSTDGSRVWVRTHLGDGERRVR
jgi:competence protein ComEC